MSITANDNGVLRKLDVIPCNDNGVLRNQDNIKDNNGGVLREIFSAIKLPTGEYALSFSAASGTDVVSFTLPACKLVIKSFSCSVSPQTVYSTSASAYLPTSGSASFAITNTETNEVETLISIAMGSTQQTWSGSKSNVTTTLEAGTYDFGIGGGAGPTGASCSCTAVIYFEEI